MTTNSCAVPTCKTGRVSVKEKRSVFKIPSNIELRKKWIAAIPGVSDLKPSQFVCEKHFLDRHIRRKWIKYDDDGRIVAEAPYARVRLDPSAVPCKFDESRPTSEHSYSSSTKSPAIGAVQTPTTMAIDDPTIDLKNSPKNISSDHAGSKTRVPLTRGPAFKKILITERSSDATDERGDRSSTEDVGTNETASDTFDDKGAESVRVGQVRTQRTTETSGCTFEFSAVDFTCTIRGRTESISIPKPWTVVKLNTDNGSVIFSHNVSKVENGENIPVTERFVKLDPDKRMRYFVQGRIVAVDEYNLPRVLDRSDLLARTLTKFKNTNLCNGIGSVNENHLMPSSVFRDHVDRWHDNECTLISKTKRCICCMKRRAVVLKRESRSKTNEALRRICQASNPIDRAKIDALREKNDRIRRMNLKTQRRVRVLEATLHITSAENVPFRDETNDRY